MCMCTATHFFIICTATYCYVLQLEMHVHLICVIKFYLLTYLLIAGSQQKLSNNVQSTTHTRLTALFQDYPGEPVPER